MISVCKELIHLISSQQKFEVLCLTFFVFPMKHENVGCFFAIIRYLLPLSSFVLPSFGYIYLWNHPPC